MVFYFTCSDPRYTIYMGRDKFENESLIAYGWPEDLWFHVDGHSSAHVYLRLPKDEAISDVPHDIVVECAQLTKLNSIAGCKLNNVKIVYCMWSNLRKTGDMATGQIGFHDRSACRYITIEKRINEIVNRLNRTKREDHNDPVQLYELRKARDRVEMDAGKQAARGLFRNLALEKEMERARLATRVETVYGWENVDEDELERADQEQMDRIMASMASRPTRGRGVPDADLCADLFGDLAEPQEPEPENDVVEGGQVELTPDELAAKAALLDVGSGAGQMETLVQVAHARRAEAEAKARAKAEGKARRLEADKAAASRPGARETVHARAAALTRAAEARISTEPPDVDFNVQAQDEEMMVMGSIFGEEDCEVEPDSRAVRLAVHGPDHSGVERTVMVHIRMGPAYPSHAPPDVYRLEGVDATDVSHVEDALRLVYFKNQLDPNSVCVMQWADWIRDEYIARQMRGEGDAAPKPGARVSAPAVTKVRREDWMDFSMAKGK
jgi:hypothetical protein